MGIISRMRREDAAYWAPAGTDDFGNPIYADPIQIKCRWEEISELFLDSAGNEQTSRAKVYVDRELELRGRLRYLDVQGRLGDAETIDDMATHPNEEEDAYEIKRVDRLPTLRVKEFLFTCYL